ncbi:hypothetical protein ACKKBG_A28045 [Auxenochlorella protothecoides x Auxenochlorella symbiontica]
MAGSAAMPTSVARPLKAFTTLQPRPTRRTRCAPERPTALNFSAKPHLRFSKGASAPVSSDGICTQKSQLLSGTGSHKDTTQAIEDLLTKSDEHFAELGLAFEWSLAPNLDELNDLFQRVGFPRRDKAKFAEALSNTHCTVWVRATRKSRMAREGQLLAFARATSDKALTATIWDVAVTPGWQRIGLGRALVERLLEALTSQGIPTITLYAEPGVVGMYEKMGFVCDPQGVKGLAFQQKRGR